MARNRRFSRTNDIHEPELIVRNTQISTQLAVDGIIISPSESVALPSKYAKHPVVAKWLRQGVLEKIKAGRSVRNYVSKRRMRVVFFVHTLFAGGAEWMTVETCRALRSYAVELWLINLYTGDPAYGTMLADKARESVDFYYEEKVASWSGAETRDRIKAIISEFAPDIVVYSCNPVVAEVAYSMQEHPPVIQVMHSELGATLDAYRSGYTDGVITVSETMAKHRIADRGISPEKVFPIWNGIDPKRLAPVHSLRKELEIPANAFVVAMVGNLNDIKQPWVGLEIFKEAAIPNSYMIFSGNPEARDKVESLAADYGLSNRIRILGYRTDVQNVYKTAAVMLNCSVSEGLPMSIIESMFCKVPVIATAVGGSAELVIHDETGYLYAVSDVESAVEHLKGLAGSKALRVRMGKAAYERAQEYFHIDVAARSYMRVFENYIIKGRPPVCSVVIPVWNGAKVIKQAIKSVQVQTMEHFECIIVDDGSDDETREIVKAMQRCDDRIRLLHQPHMGIVPALNYGIKAAKTDIIVRMDADDMMFNDRLERQLGFLKEHKDIDVVGGQMVCTHPDGKLARVTTYPLTHKEIEAGFYTGNMMGHPAVTFRKLVWKTVGGYRGDGRAEDYWLWTDAIVAGFKFANLPDPVLKYTMTHEFDGSYGEWVNSVNEAVQKSYTERMAVVERRPIAKKRSDLVIANGDTNKESGAVL